VTVPVGLPPRPPDGSAPSSLSASLTPAFSAFSEGEHRDRLARARETLRTAGFDGCVSVAPETLYYLAGYDAWVSVNSPQALIFRTDGGEPTVVLRDVDRSLALETAWVRDLRTYRLLAEDPTVRIAEAAHEQGLAAGRLAVEFESYALPHALGLRLARALGPARMQDATELLGDLRLVKSSAEVAYLRDAARYAGIGLETARRALRPGITEVALAGAIEGAMRAAGSDFWAIPTELASGPRTPGGHATPRDRILEPGDLVHVEFAGVARRYHAVAIQTMALGNPNRRAREIYQLTRASLRAGVRAVRPGVPAEAVEEASLEPLRKAGLEGAAMMRFGYGVGVAYPPIWLETLQISRGIERRLEPGMVFVLHACVELVDEGIGVIQGGTYLLTTRGLEMLAGAGDVDLHVG
jgi:Xaa-Pro dipeptidase